jgi:hypothetical protein
MQVQTVDQPLCARVEIPKDWLLPGLAVEEIRAAQRDDALVRFAGDVVVLQGIELTVGRHWIRERFWGQVGNTAVAGYVHRSSAVEVVFRPERRVATRRQASFLLARMPASFH